MSATPRTALVVLPTGLKGGAESVALALVRQLSREGWHVDVLAMSRGMQPALRQVAQCANVAVTANAYRSEKASLPATVAQIALRSRRRRYALVYSTHLHVNAALGLMRRLGLLRCERLGGRGATVIFDRFHGLKRALFRALYRIGYGPQDALVLQTPEMLRSLEAALGRCPVSNPIVLPNPIDLEPVRAALAQAAPAAPARKRVVACGRLIPIKGFAALVEAFSRVAGEFPDYDLELIGSGEEEARLKAMVDERAMADRVVFHGHQDCPWPLMKDADVGVVSSEREGFPNVLLEMMACSVRRIVATPCTAWVRTIPHITVCAATTADAIAEALRAELASAEDRSGRFMDYVRHTHSLPRFASVVAGCA